MAALLAAELADETAPLMPPLIAPLMPAVIIVPLTPEPQFLELYTLGGLLREPVFW